MQLATEKIVAEKQAGVGWLTINNPERRNAITLDMWRGIGDALDNFAVDSSVRCVVMKGAGDKAFASGADISQFERHRADAAAAENYDKVARASRESMVRFEKPLIAMIRGYCMGGGLGIAMTADLRIAAADGIFGIPAARLGVAYAFNDLRQLVHLVGPSKAKEILLTARRNTADEALAMGLVNTVVPVAELDAAVKQVTDRLVENAPLSLRASKLTINEVVKDQASRDPDLIQRLASDCFNSEDYKEGRTAFMEKRVPQFTGS